MFALSWRWPTPSNNGFAWIATRPLTSCVPPGTHGHRAFESCRPALQSGAPVGLLKVAPEKHGDAGGFECRDELRLGCHRHGIEHAVSCVKNWTSLNLNGTTFMAGMLELHRLVV